MKINQQLLLENQSVNQDEIDFEPNLILAFGGKSQLQSSSIQEMRLKYPQAIMAGCTTAGEIAKTSVYDDSLALNFIGFDNSSVIYREVNLADDSASYSSGTELAQSFPEEGFVHCLVLSVGLNVNGTQLVSGLKENLPKGVALTGGLAADGPNFNETFVLDNEGKTSNSKVIAVGFYGDLKIAYASLGGWDSFGLERTFTKSDNNVLYELDGKPALELYKSFLGEEANNLPSSALLFPLSMRSEAGKTPLVRTILGISEDDQSLTFAGDIPEGATVRLMKANVDRLIDGAQEAASIIQQKKSEFALCISCVGRKLVLKQIVEEEVEACQEELGENCTITGFYSYGEIAPFKEGAECELHNQTMTITSFSEIEG